MPPRKPVGPQFRWDVERARFVDARGNTISASAIRRELDKYLAVATKRVRAMGEQLRLGEITVEEWELAMRGLAKDVHLANAAAARGGWSQMGPSDYGRVGRVVRDEYAWIRNFRSEIDKGLPLDGRFLARTELYAQAGRETFHKVERQVQLEQGNTLERSILGVADHCEGAGSCIGEAARGWVLVGQLIPIGQRLCGRRCKCRIEYSSIAALTDDLMRDAPEIPPEQDTPYRAKYASAVMDVNTCVHCAAFNNVIVSVNEARRLPDHACTSARGCQCAWIFIRKDEAP